MVLIHWTETGVALVTNHPFLHVRSADRMTIKRFAQETATNTVGGATLPSPEESAKALSEFMAKSHEEKLKAVAKAEDKGKERIKELEGQVADLESKLTVATAEGSTPPVTVVSSNNSIQMPGTNKFLTEKVEAYQKFLAQYIVNVSMEKNLAVKDAEQKAKAKYEEKVNKIAQGKSFE